MPADVRLLDAGEDVVALQISRVPSGRGGKDWIVLTESSRTVFRCGSLQGAGELAWLRTNAEGRPEWLGGLHLERLSWEGNPLHTGLAPEVDLICSERTGPRVARRPAPMDGSARAITV
jgi:hypothetical protein